MMARRTTRRRSRRSGSASGTTRARGSRRTRPTRAAAEPKSYVLEMLPYPSGSLHLGHLLVYTIGDVVTRFRRRTGMHVLHPMGWDAFGLPGREQRDQGGRAPARDHGAQHRRHPRSMKRMGWAYDWTRELSTHDPDYYRWQQWQFLRFLEQGLAYRKGAPVKWCPNDQTVLANEQVLADGTCERCGAARRVTRDGAVVLPDHRLRRRAARRPRRRSTGPSRSRPPAELDRPLRGPEIDFRIEEWDEDVPSSRHARTRSSARRSSCSRPSTNSWRGSSRTRCRRLRAARRREEDRGARRGGREDGCLPGLHA